MREITILILSAGTRNKIVQFYKEILKDRGKVIAADCSPYAPALYEADEAVLTPRITEPGYLDTVLEIVRTKHVNGCFSLIDPELILLAENAERFRELGCTPMISPAAAVDASFHKARMCRMFAEAGLHTPQFWTDMTSFEAALQAGRIAFPVFVKPEDGSASLGIRRIEDHEELLAAAREYGRTPDSVMMIQEFMDGQEYGADVYIDMLSGQCVSIFLKKKLRMRAGETDKSVSVHNEEVFSLIRDFVERTGFRGQIDIDLFEKDGRYYFSEVNPRYGGGYPHAFYAGADMPSMYIRNLEGTENPVAIGDYRDGVVMMKYNETMIVDEKELVV